MNNVIAFPTRNGVSKPFAIGDCVTLKSGGWNMIVTGINNNQVQCSWFAPVDGSPHVQSFSTDVLQLRVRTMQFCHDTYCWLEP